MTATSTQGAANSTGGLPEVWRTQWALPALATCTGLGLLFAGHLRFYHRVEWPLALWWGLKDWYLWGALAPVVFWLVRRFPLRGQRWLRPALVHLAGAVGLVVIHSTLSVSIAAMFEGLGGLPWFAAVRALVLKKSAAGLITYGAIAGVAAGVGGARRGRDRDRDALDRPVADGVDRHADRLLVRRGQQQRFVEVAQIDRVEAQGNYVRIHSGASSHLERRTLSSLERQLDPSRFLRIHRSHLVNIERVDRIELGAKGYQVVLADGTTLSLSRSYRKRLEERIGASL